jgi:hypothetical protein
MPTLISTSRFRKPLSAYVFEVRKPSVIGDSAVGKDLVYLANAEGRLAFSTPIDHPRPGAVTATAQ